MDETTISLLGAIRCKLNSLPIASSEGMAVLAAVNDDLSRLESHLGELAADLPDLAEPETVAVSEPTEEPTPVIEPELAPAEPTAAESTPDNVPHGTIEPVEPELIDLT